MKYAFILLVFSIFLNGAYGQEQSQESLTEKEQESFKNAHRITLAMGHSYIRKGFDHNTSPRGILVPSWMLDYDYWLTNRLALGLQSDVVIDDFMVEDHLGGSEEIVFKRSFPVSVVPAVLVKPWKNLVCLAGAGRDFAPEGNFWLYRTGVEYGFNLPKQLELNLSLTYDIKVDAYDMWTLGVGVSKVMLPHHAGHHKHS